MSAPVGRWLTAKYPCCGRKARIRATVDVPRETYDRTCACGSRWDVERRTARQDEGIRVDVLEWTEVQS